jgi:hypothetical protein
VRRTYGRRKRHVQALAIQKAVNGGRLKGGAVGDDHADPATIPLMINVIFAARFWRLLPKHPSNTLINWEWSDKILSVRRLDARASRSEGQNVQDISAFLQVKPAQILHVGV